jgi:ATP-dependent Clp protease ATP-binding subunit ClpX
MDTSNILFICGGTFVGLDKMISKRLGRKKIGFTGEGRDLDERRDMGRILAEVTPDDLIEFGVIPEFVGRLPVICPLAPLDEQALVEILTEPKNAIVRQYQKLFELEKAELTFTKDALIEIARKAIARDTGARALRSVTEEFMIEYMFELPELKAGTKYTVTPEVVRSEEDLLAPGRLRKESA